jgi:hypothetical protein
MPQLGYSILFGRLGKPFASPSGLPDCSTASFLPDRSTPFENTKSRARRFEFIKVRAFWRRPLRSKLYMELPNYLLHRLLLSYILLGSHQECLHGLMTYGIPSHLIPIHHEGELKLDRHTKWTEWRKRTDHFQHQHWRIVLVPGREDVLFGSDRTQSCQGNVRFHQMLVSNASEYQQASATEKMTMRKQIWNSLRARNGRFLQPIENGTLWEPMEEDVALSKIGQAFDFLCVQLGSQTTVGRLQVADMWDFGDLCLSKQCLSLMHCNENSKGCVSNQSCWQH